MRALSPATARRTAWMAGVLAALLWAAGCGMAERQPPTGAPPGSVGGGTPVTSSGGTSSSSSSGSGAGGQDEQRIDDPDAPCDESLSTATKDPDEAAAAIGICKHATSTDDWGLIDATWVRVDGSADVSDGDYHLGHGVLGRFGKRIDPREGQHLLALSSGSARLPGQLGYHSPAGFDKEYVGGSPDGFPKESPTCEGILTGPTHDDVALELSLRAPPAAQSLAFDFDFYTYEWPDWVCSQFNDFFVALLEPYPDGQPDGNISFDQLGNPVSVNNALVRVCDCTPAPPCKAPPQQPAIAYDCELGDKQLEDTGFETRAATGWLVTRAPVVGGEVIKLRLGVYDSGDGILDSTTVVDDFRWLADPTDGPGTGPVPR